MGTKLQLEDFRIYSLFAESHHTVLVTCQLTLRFPQCTSRVLILDLQFSWDSVVYHVFLLVLGSYSVLCFLFYSQSIFLTLLFLLSPQPQFCFLQPDFPFTFNRMFKGT
jgi:hypothetical protein